MVLAAGTTAPLLLEVERGEAQLSLEVLTQDLALIRAGELKIPRDATLWAGLTLAPLTVERASHFGTSLEGVDPRSPIVIQVAPDSPAAMAGLRPGDLIVEIRGQGVNGPTAPGRITGDRSTVSVTIWRGTGEVVAIVSGLD